MNKSVKAVSKKSRKPLRKQSTSALISRSRAQAGFGVGKYKLVNTLPKSIHQVLPQSYTTKMINNWTGFSAAANGNFPNIQFSVYGNTLYQPFNTGVTLTGQGFTSSTGYTILSQYTGYTTLALIYKNIRVRSTKIIIYLDTNSSDVVGCAVAPCANTPSAINYNSISSLPYAKGIITNNNDTRRECKFSAYANSATVLGLSKNQFEALDPVTAQTATPVTDQSWVWYGALSMLNAASGSNAGAMTINITLESEVEWYDLIPQIQ